MRVDYIGVEPGASVGISAEDQATIDQLQATGYVTPAELSELTSGTLLTYDPLEVSTDVVSTEGSNLGSVISVTYDGGLCLPTDYTFSSSAETITFTQNLPIGAVIQVFGVIQ